MLNRVLSQKQAAYSSNYERMREKFDDISELLDELRLSDVTKYKEAAIQYKKVVNWFNSQNFDYSSSVAVSQGMSVLKDLERGIISGLKGSTISFKYRFG